MKGGKATLLHLVGVLNGCHNANLHPEPGAEGVRRGRDRAVEGVEWPILPLKIDVLYVAAVRHNLWQE
jgi:hypothetical protein